MNPPHRCHQGSKATQARPYTLDDDELVQAELDICYALLELDHAERRRRAALARLGGSCTEDPPQKPVTDAPKRNAANVFVCIGCDRLAFSDRSDSLTCSDACRVKANRNGDMKRLKDEAKSWKVHPSALLRAMAGKRLIPDCYERTMRNELYLESKEGKEELWQAFQALVERVMEMAEEGGK